MTTLKVYEFVPQGFSGDTDARDAEVVWVAAFTEQAAKNLLPTYVLCGEIDVSPDDSAVDFREV